MIQLPDYHPLAKKTRNKYAIQENPRIIREVLSQYPDILNDKEKRFYLAWAERMDDADKIKHGEYKIPDIEFKVKPFEHQKKIISFILNTPANAVFADPGTGKTYCAIMAFQYRLRTKKCKKVLVVAPASIIRASWYEDIKAFSDIKARIVKNKYLWSWMHPIKKTHHRKMSSAIKSIRKKDVGIKPDEELLWNDDRDIKDVLNSNYEMFIVSYDTLIRNKDAFLEAGFDAIILDESTCIKNPTGKRTEVLHELGNTVKYRTIMTGTPITNSLEDIWSQMQFVDKSISHNITEFREKYMQPHPHVKMAYIKRKGAEEEITKIIKDSCIWVKKDECLDLPDRMVIKRKVGMTSKLEKFYDEMLFDNVAVIDKDNDTAATAFNPLSVAIRLRQITNGFVTDENGNTVELEKAIELPKIDIIKEISDMYDKVVIWAIYRKDIDNLVYALGYKNCAVIDGRTKDIIKELSTFRGSKKYMIAHPGSARFGLTMTWCRCAVFYSYDQNVESYLQARDRIYRIGQKEKVDEYILMGSEIDEITFRSMTEKVDFAKLCLEYINEESK